MRAFESPMDNGRSKDLYLTGADNKLHVACIMDGNRRWAAAHNAPALKGHQAGVEALRLLVTAAPDNGIGVLTVYAFSSDNWRRPIGEIEDLIHLFRDYLDSETENLVRDGVRLTIVGRRDRLPENVIAEIERSEAATQWGDTLHLRIAIDYSSREAILAAVKTVAASTGVTKETFGKILSGGTDHADVDLLIRTSGEQRLSDFLLWECAYAELYFSNRLWPDFTEQDLVEALIEFRRRDRRFGGRSIEAA
jgi:undecaprenyl diphosphate synthase